MPVPFYSLIQRLVPKKHQLRCIDNLQKLRALLDATLPDKDAENTLLLATWNIRDFDKANRRGFGARLPETFFYIAEIISRFGFVAVQEVNRLDEWRLVMQILGDNYDYIATDATDRDLGGNGERLVFVFDKRKVWFQNIVGEIVLPAGLLISTNVEERPDDKAPDATTRVEADGAGTVEVGKQFARTPFIACFQSHWLRFAICTVHIYYGESSGEKLRQRIAEIDRIARFLSHRADQELQKHDRAMILLGDFNIVSPEHETMAKLEAQDFVIPKALKRKTNALGTKFYDQIAFKTRPDVVEFVEGQGRDGKPNAGIVPIYDAIMQDADAAQWFDDMRAGSRSRRDATEAALAHDFPTWKTYQLSDHVPLWARLYVNSSERYLTNLATRIAG